MIKNANVIFLSCIGLSLLFFLAGCSANDATTKGPKEPASEHAIEPVKPEPRSMPIGTNLQPAGNHTASRTKAKNSIRFATYNTSLYRKHSGQLVKSLASAKDQQAAAIAEVIQRVRPDVLLLNEFDYDSEHRSVKLFQKLYLAKSQRGQEPIAYPFVFTAPSNTGIPSGQDFNNDGKVIGGNDAFGYGKHPGQYGMVVFSRFPIETKSLRTFQKFLWKDMPGALLPMQVDSKGQPTGKPFYDDKEIAIFRLASKSFWDVPIIVPQKNGPATIHFLVSHPTPPVFDGAEDRNGKRNHDEIRMLADYVSPERGQYLYDDAGKHGGLSAKARFIIAGDLNADPYDGERVERAVRQLLEHSKIQNRNPPASSGGRIAATIHPELNANHKGNPRFDTADFGADGVGNLRVDYVLPSKTLTVTSSGVFWPLAGEAGYSATLKTDHRMTWIDILSE